MRFWFPVVLVYPHYVYDFARLLSVFFELVFDLVSILFLSYSLLI